MADISDAVCWIKDGHWARRRCWDEGSYIYQWKGVVHVHTRGADPSSEVLVTGEDLLADDWELHTDLRVSLDQMRRGEGTVAITYPESRVGRVLTWSDEEPPIGSTVTDRSGDVWRNTGTLMGSGEMHYGGANWQIDMGHYGWSDPESWTRVCEYGPITVVSWGY